MRLQAVRSLLPRHHPCPWLSPASIGPHPPLQQKYQIIENEEILNCPRTNCLLNMLVLERLRRAGW